MFMLASHQFKNHPTNQDQLRGWKLADQAYWILLFLFGFSKFGFTGDVQNIRTHRSSSPHQSKWVQMSLDFEFCICIENVSKAVTLLCIPHVNLLTCCHTSNYIARNPRCPFGEPCHLSSSSLEPLRPAISKRSCTRHASERIIGLIVLGSIVQKSRWVLSVCIESADLKPFFLSAVAPQLWDVSPQLRPPGSGRAMVPVFPTPSKQCWWQALRPFGFGFGEGLGLGCGWACVRGGQQPLLSPLYRRLCHLSLRFCFNEKAGIVSSRAMMNSAMVYISTCQDITLEYFRHIQFNLLLQVNLQLKRYCYVHINWWFCLPPISSTWASEV